MNVCQIKEILKKIARKYGRLLFFLHLFRYCISNDYRSNNSLIPISHNFYYKYGRALIFFLRPVIHEFLRDVERENMIISVNNVMAIGHIYPEIDLLIRELSNNPKLKDKTILFSAPKNRVLIESKKIFERENLKIVINGYKHFVATLAAIYRPDLSICVSQSSLNIVHGKKNVTVGEVFKVRQVSRAEKISNDRNYYPLRYYGELENSGLILSLLEVSKKYVLIQIKATAVNGTLTPTNPYTLLKTIDFLRSNNYDVIFVGREKMPIVFQDYGVINYSESVFANALNDYMLVFNAEMVISSGSGYSFIPELLDVPMLQINSWQHVSAIGRKTVIIPTLIKKGGRLMNFMEQYNFVFSDLKLNKSNVPIEDYNLEAVDADSDDIYDATNELLSLTKNGWELTETQIKIKRINGFNMLGIGMSRISNSFATRYIDLFYNS